ncbi:hypothetical protein G314FT_09490 [Vagococcus luciliae]|uniref:CAAX prenyl protease 2/Lysostaphin resistance protein A-like domain-containing protein n=2 Tax=Vagococcus luciliae TaxID=2920380 RepID=A0ABY5NYQ7_9ENTE|nr:hypothetical protein G314FT_09490 [Vagococcus luciliae]
MSINKNMLYTSFLYLFLLNRTLLFSLNNVVTIFLYTMILMFILIIYVKTNKEQSLNHSGTSLKKLVTLIVIGLILSFFTQIFIIFLTTYFFPNLILVNNRPVNLSWSFIMITIFFNPIIEELVFRFSFVNWIGQKLPIWVGIVISSLIFMLMHINGNLFIYFCLGIIFSGLYKISGTIMTPIMVHILLNGIILFAT